MGLQDWTTDNDKFEPEEGGLTRMSFPCCACKHQSKTDVDEPCRSCGHNLNACNAAGTIVNHIRHAHLRERVLRLNVTVEQFVMANHPFGTPAERCAWVFGQPMEPCPQCGSYKLTYQMPIKLDEPLPDDLDAKKLLGAWARARRSGATPLEGTSYLMCKNCRHKGPSVDVTGRTSEDVGRDPEVAKEIKRLWNAQDHNIQLCDSGRGWTSARSDSE